MTTRDDAIAALDIALEAARVEGAQSRDAEVQALIAHDAILTTRVGELEAEVDVLQAYKDAHPDDEEPPPPPPKTAIFSAYAGPDGKGMAGQSTPSRARVSAAFGVAQLPADRVYSATGFGKAIQCPSKIVAVSYGLVPELARGDSTVIANLTAELKSLGKKTDQRFDASCDHEVDSKIRDGRYSGAQVKAAHARFAQVIRDAGVTNVRHALCVTGYGLTLKTSDPSHPDNYYADVYGLLAGDPYWPAQPSAEAAFDPFYVWAKGKGKPLAVWETGYQIAGNPQRPTEAQLKAKVQAVVDYWKTKAEYVLWFEADRTASSGVSNLLEGHPEALAIWSAAVKGSLNA